MANVKRNALGRGLDALLEENSITSGVTEVDIMSVEPFSNQPRKKFEEEKLQELAESIRVHGIIQPIVVCPRGNNYRIIAGERRWRAARMAELKKIPVIIREATDKEIMELALIENIQREDLNPIEEARAIQTLMDDYSLTQQDLSGIIGKSRSDVANTVRLLNLCEKVQELIIDGKLTPGQARPLLVLPDDLQVSAADYIITKGLTARKVEAIVTQLKNKAISEAEAKVDFMEEHKKELLRRDTEYMQSKLRAALGTKVKLDDRDGKGKIIIEYFSTDERERLLEYLIREEE